MFAPNCFLYMIMSKNSNNNNNNNIKKYTLSKVHPQSDHIINTQIKQVKSPRMFCGHFNFSLQAKTASKWCRAYKAEKSPFCSTFARKMCDDAHLPGWLPTFLAHSQTFKPIPASFTHKKPTIMFNKLENHSSALSFFKCWGFLQSSI